MTSFLALERFRVLGAILVLLGAALPSRADVPPINVFVGPAGDDQNGGGTIGNPYATVARAIAAIGDNSGVAYLLPGDYASEMITPGFRSPGRQLTLEGYYGNATVTVSAVDEARPIVKLNGPDVKIKGIRFHGSGASPIALGLGADNVMIESCVFDHSASDQEGLASVLVEPHAQSRISHLTVRNNTFLGARFAALALQGETHFVHFLGNTVHLAGSGRGVVVEGGAYSGVIIDNNIFHFIAPPQNAYVIEFNGEGRGTRVNLNCFSTEPPASGTGLKPANRLATKSVMDLTLPFNGFSHFEPGRSLRGTCMDIYSQEHLGALKRTVYLQ